MADLGSLMASTERRKEGSGSAKISENLDRRANSRIQRNRGKTRLSKERRSAVNDQLSAKIGSIGRFWISEIFSEESRSTSKSRISEGWERGGACIWEEGAGKEVWDWVMGRKLEIENSKGFDVVWPRSGCLPGNG